VLSALPLPLLPLLPLLPPLLLLRSKCVALPAALLCPSLLAAVTCCAALSLYLWAARDIHQALQVQGLATKVSAGAFKYQIACTSKHRQKQVLRRSQEQPLSTHR
jgi:hypothetical protein